MVRMLRDIAILVFGLGLIYTCMFTVDETEYKVVMQFGKPIAQYLEPGGPHFKLPWPIQSVTSVDNRWQIYHSLPREIITKDKKTILVAIFSLFKITDAIDYLKNTQSIANAQTRMDEIVYSEMHNMIGGLNFDEVVITNRSEIMNTVETKANGLLKQYAVESGIVRMNEVDLPPENQKSVFSRMSEERKRQAKLYRAEGAEDSTRITAETNKEAKFITSEAQNEAQRIHGRADARAAAIYNAAYGQSPEFFRLLTSLDVVKNVYSGNSDVSVVLTGKEQHLQDLFGGDK